MGIGSESELDSGGAKPLSGCDSVRQVPLGGRAHAARGAGAAQQPDIGVGQVRAVNPGEALVQRAGVGENSGRRRTVGPARSLVLGRLLRHVGVKRRFSRARPTGDGRCRLRVHRADAVDRRTDACAGVARQLHHALRPRFGVAIAEPQLRPGELLANATVQITGVD